MSYNRALIITAQDVQDEEFIYPFYRLQEERFVLDVWVIGKENSTCKYGTPIRPIPGKQLIMNGQMGWGGYDEGERNLLTNAYDLIVIPGGWAPEIVRMNQDVLQFIRGANKWGKIISAICHGPQVLISAGICKNKSMTGYIGIKDDIINAGGDYQGAGVSIDGNIVTADHYRENHNWMKATLEVHKKLILKEYAVH